jgi:hypothetical protein
MKSSLRCFVSVLGLVAAMPTWAAESAPKTAEAKPETKGRKEIRVITTTGGLPASEAHRMVRRIGEPGATERVTFLGVETGPVSATLAAQLGLNEGAGLVVNHLVPDSPAAGVLKQHDILLKLDDQILIEQRQLAVLVRGYKEGDEVTLTYMRGGKQATAKVKLSKHEAPKLTLMFDQSGPTFGPAPFGGQASMNRQGSGPGNFDFHVGGPDGQGNREEVNRVLSLIDGANAPGQRRITIARPGGPGDRNVSVTVNTGNSRIISEDEKGSLELTIDDGKKHLVAKNSKREEIFAGPVNTPEERKALPAEVRERLEKLEDMKQFSFRTDGDFKGAETRILRPRGQGISIPAQPAVPAQRPAIFF